MSKRSPRRTTRRAKADSSLAAIAEVEKTRDALRARARTDLGVTGDEDTPPLRDVLREESLSIYPLVALGVLGIVDTFQSYAFSVLTPEISRALGISLGAIAGIRTLQFLAISLAPLPMAALSQSKRRRAMLCITTGIAWSVITLTTGFVVSLITLLVVLVLDGLSTGSVAALHPPLISDSYPPRARVRAFSTYQAIVISSSIIAPALVGILAGAIDLTWRGVFIAMGVTSTLGCLAAIGLRDPGFGRFDTERVKAEVSGQQAEAVDDADIRLGFFEVVRRLLLIPTIQRLMAGYLVIGVLLIPFATFLSEFLDQRWGLGPGKRGAFFAAVSAVGVVGLLLWGRRGEQQFRRNPAGVISDAGTFIAVAVVLIAVGALMPAFWLMFLFFAAGSLLIALITPGLAISTLSIVDARWRPHLAALSGIFQAAGSILGVVFLSGMYTRYGISGSLVALVIPGVAGALIIRSARKLIAADLDRMIDELLEAEEIRQLQARGETLPMLACRGIDFSYGQLQVLFGVDFTVDDGELVALLGVNGAGKSTLLKVVSGIGLPSRGSVRFRGHDVTYLDAERRLRLGITQIPGGRAVFGPMTVVENLRSFGYTIRSDRRRLDEAMDRSFEAFPRLAERRHAAAVTLSGGEQQMLGLAKALILQPRLLLIDELSLGLAPVIVAQLLEMVRKINQEGCAVVLVEQSVNVALELAEHAYFMEKGEIRFDGRSADLLRRDDLLRAVFLEGASTNGGRANARR